MSEISISIARPAATPVPIAPPKAKSRGSRRRIISGLALIAADFCAVQAAFMLAGLAAWLFSGDPPAAGFVAREIVGISPAGSSALVPWTVEFWSGARGAAVALAVFVPAAASGLYDAAGLSPLERFRLRIYVAAILPWLGLALVALIQPVPIDVVRILAAAAVLFVPLSLIAESCVRAVLIARDAWGADVLVVGSSRAARRVATELLAHPEIGLRPIGYCGDPVNGATPHPLPRLGTLADIDTFAGTADIVVVALSAGDHPLDFARLPFDRIVMIPDIGDIPAVFARTRTVGESAGLDFANPGRARSHHRVKRLLDVAIALPALVVALPLILCIAAAIFILSPGPAFYVQRRVGWRGRPVAIFKLRSMYTDADRRLEDVLSRDPVANLEWETYVKLSRDPRILPIIGDFIRRTSIDELPQLWNVIRGDISLVGPRPFPAYHIAKFSPEFQKLRSSVRPGLTGLWQVSDRNNADLRRQETIDTFYIRNWSLWLDLYVVVRTFPAVLGARGAR